MSSRYTASGDRTVVRWVILAIFLSAALGTAQSQSGQQDELRRAVELQQAGRYDEAISAYRAFLKVHPEAAPVRSNLGAALVHEGQYNDAVREYSQALAAQPGNYAIRLNRALAYFKNGDLNDAVNDFETVHAVLPPGDPQNHRVLLLLAECYLRQGEDERVIAILSPVADADPSDMAAAYLLGTAFLHQGEEERGAQMIQRILKNGDTAEAHMLMAFTKMKANDYHGSMAELNRAIQLNPNLPEAYSLRGRLAFIDSDLAAAESSFRSALALDPNAFEALLLLGSLLREQGRLNESGPLLERAYQLRPQEIRVRYQLAIQHSSEGDDKRAAAMLEALIKDSPSYTEAHRSLSSIYFRLGRTDDGRRERKIAESLDEAIQSHDRQIGQTLK